jgi:hypothetical protein
MNLRVFTTLDSLPSIYLDLLNDTGRDNFYFSLPWYRALTGTTGEADDTLLILGVESGDRQPVARGLMVARRQIGKASAYRTRELSLFQNVYTMIAGPAVRVDEGDKAGVIDALVQEMTGSPTATDIIHLGGMDPGSENFPLLESALRKAGWWVAQTPGFINWFELTTDLTWENYLASLPGKMRTLLRRRERRLEKAGDITWLFSDGGENLDKLLSDYAIVHESSWKPPEGSPDFTEAFVRACATSGVLRMGLLYLNGTPAAAQIWTVSNGGATIYKLSYGKQFREYSVGSILTARMMRRILEIDRPAIIDFGNGDDPYKKDWLRHKRVRMNLIAFNPKSARGLLAGARFFLRRLIGKLI